MMEAPLQRYLDALETSAETHHALAAPCYTDPALFDVEVERVLRPAWHPVARHDSLPEAGDFEATELYGEPLVIVRDESGRLRVFSNVCPHRGHLIAHGRGHDKQLTCVYHRWAFGLDGGLKGAPLMKDEPAFDASACGLPELKTELWQGFLMTSLDPDAAPFAAELGSLDEILADSPLDDYVTLGQIDFDSPWNWKVMIDNFMESYHHLGAHADTLQPTNPANRTYSQDVEGPFSVLRNPGTEPANDFLVLQAFPTLLFFVQPSLSLGIWYELGIDRHDHLDLKVWLLMPAELAAQPGMAELVAEQVQKVHLEDIAVCESVQRGMQSRLWRPGPLSRLEGCLGRFHAHIAKQLRA